MSDKDYEIIKPSWEYMKYLEDKDLFNLITEKEFDKKRWGQRFWEL